jgi:hypothetical protein
VLDEPTHATVVGAMLGESVVARYPLTPTVRSGGARDPAFRGIPRMVLGTRIMRRAFRGFIG